MLDISYGRSLNPADLIGTVLGSADPGHIHIIVAAPKVIHMHNSTLTSTMDHIDEQDVVPYKNAAKQLDLASVVNPTKHGHWLSIFDPDVETLAKSFPNLEMLDISYGRSLNPADLIGTVFGSADPGRIHIIVAAPKAIHMHNSTLTSTMDHIDDQDVVPYKNAAKHLQFASAVDLLVGVIDRVKNTDGNPFILLEGSTGVGKT
ncbi:hypothetical protein PInf_019375 [Phytophthora infestans]|nr:hypothetical protein PInf_019375 [Phytophthora infestans]